VGNAERGIHGMMISIVSSDGNGSLLQTTVIVSHTKNCCMTWENLQVPKMRICMREEKHKGGILLDGL
jgi:hypothetical protein